MVHGHESESELTKTLQHLFIEQTVNTYLRRIVSQNGLECHYAQMLQ
jgi:hypothetical protein